LVTITGKGFIMRVINLLNENDAKYDMEDLSSVYTAQRLAEETHTPGSHVLKTVILRMNRRHIMAVIPADHRLDIEKLTHVLGGNAKPQLVLESELPDLCDDADTGAEAPFGDLYGMETVMEESLHNTEHEVVFLAGSHHRAIRMPVTEYVRIANPILAPISTHI